VPPATTNIVSPADTPSTTIAARRTCLLLTALLWWFAGQRFGLFALAWIAFIPFLWAATSLTSPWARWKYGYATGTISYILINWWIVVAVTRGAPMIGAPQGMGTVLGVVAIVLIGLIQGVGVGLVAVAWQPGSAWARKAPWRLPLIIALLWYLFETIRSSTPLAHGWGALAFSQWRDTALLQCVSLIGQHGLSALCVWFAASLALWLRRDDAPAHLWRAPVLVFVALHVWGAWQLNRFDSRTATARPLRLLLVQTEISSMRKNDEKAPGPSPFAQAYGLTRQHLAENGGRGAFDLVLWPETTVSVFTEPLQVTSSPLAPQQQGQKNAIRMQGMEARSIESLCRDFDVSVLTGANNPDSGRELYNMAILAAPDGRVVANSKQRLVPFGERAPFGDSLPLLNRFAPVPPVAPGKQSDPLPLRVAWRAEPVRVGSLICFESCFPDPARQLRRGGAQMLTILTNDEWFSGTDAPWEHAAMAAVRAVESRVPVVQSANGGYALVVDACGRFLVKSPPGVARALPATVNIEAF